MHYELYPLYLQSTATDFVIKVKGKVTLTLTRVSEWGQWVGDLKNRCGSIVVRSW
jgi:hypothetical protein